MPPGAALAQPLQQDGWTHDHRIRSSTRTTIFLDTARTSSWPSNSTRHQLQPIKNPSLTHGEEDLSLSVSTSFQIKTPIYRQRSVKAVSQKVFTVPRGFK